MSGCCQRPADLRAHAGPCTNNARPHLGDLSRTCPDTSHAGLEARRADRDTGSLGRRRAPGTGLIPIACTPAATSNRTRVGRSGKAAPPREPVGREQPAYAVYRSRCATWRGEQRESKEFAAGRNRHRSAQLWPGWQQRRKLAPRRCSSQGLPRGPPPPRIPRDGMYHDRAIGDPLSCGWLCRSLSRVPRGLRGGPCEPEHGEGMDTRVLGVL